MSTVLVQAVPGLAPVHHPPVSTQQAPPLAPRLWPPAVQVAMMAGLGVLFLALAARAPRAEPLLAPSQPRLIVDLNHANEAELQLLPGVGSKLAQAIVHYRQTRGPFENAADLQKVPGIGKTTWARLRPYVMVDADSLSSIPSQRTHTKTSLSAPGKTSTGSLRIDINAADSAELDQLPGIGPVLAVRILEARAKKGPFRSMEDLRGIRGLGVKTLAKIAPHLRF